MLSAIHFLCPPLVLPHQEAAADTFSLRSRSVLAATRSLLLLELSQASWSCFICPVAVSAEMGWVFTWVVIFDFSVVETAQRLTLCWTWSVQNAVYQASSLFYLLLVGARCLLLYLQLSPSRFFFRVCVCLLCTLESSLTARKMIAYLPLLLIRMICKCWTWTRKRLPIVQGHDLFYNISLQSFEISVPGALVSQR